jgi:hypothetical protein
MTPAHVVVWMFAVGAVLECEGEALRAELLTQCT